jgi:hypothetical protein
VRFLSAILLSALAGATIGVLCFWRGQAGNIDVLAARSVHAHSSSARSEDGKDARQPPAVDSAAAVVAALRFKNNKLRCAHDLFAALQNFDANDFRSLASDRTRVVAMLEDCEKLPWEICVLLMEGIVERWVEVDPSAAVAWLNRSDDVFEKHQGFERSIMEAFARKMPEQTFSYALARSTSKERERCLSIVVPTIAARDPEHARGWIERIQDEKLRNLATDSWQNGLAKATPLAAADLALSMADTAKAEAVWNAAVSEAERRGPAELSALAAKSHDSRFLGPVAAAMAARDPQGAAQLANELLAKATPGEARLASWQYLDAVTQAYVRKDAAAAAEWAAALPAAARPGALGIVAKSWAAEDPQAALAWLDANSERLAIDKEKPLAQQADPRMAAFGSWLQRDEGAARAWSDGLPGGEMRNAAEAQLILLLAQTGRGIEAAQKCAVFSGDPAGEISSRVARELARTDPISAAKWAAELPAGKAQERAVTETVTRWTLQDPPAVGRWLEQFAPSEVRDRAIATYAGTLAIADPSMATEWVIQVSDPLRRTQAAQNLFWRWNLSDPAAARAWLQALPGIDEESRRIFLHDNK